MPGGVYAGHGIAPPVKQAGGAIYTFGQYAAQNPKEFQAHAETSLASKNRRGFRRLATALGAVADYHNSVFGAVSRLAAF